MAGSKPDRVVLRSRLAAQRLRVQNLTDQLRSEKETLLELERQLIDATKRAHGVQTIDKKK